MLPVLTYINSLVELEGAFHVNGTSDPDGFEDGNTNLIKSVTRVSAGLFEVQLETDKGAFPYMPQSVINPIVTNSPPSATVGVVVKAHLVDGTWDASARKFRIQCVQIGSVALSAYADPLAADPDDNTKIGFYFRGSYSPVGKD